MDRRDRYLDAALTLFAKHGFVGTTMDMVIAEVGGSKATLYNTFPSKKDLVAGLIERAIATNNADGRDYRPSQLPIDEELALIGHSVCDAVWGDASVAVLGLCLGEVGRFPDLAKAVWDHGPKITYAKFHDFIAERQREGLIDVDNPQFAAEQFLAGLVGHLQLKIAFGLATLPDEAEVDARVDSSVKTFLARYATREGHQHRRSPG